MGMVFLTSKVIEAVRGQKQNSKGTLWYFNQGLLKFNSMPYLEVYNKTEGLDL